MVAPRDGGIQGWWHSGSQICKLGALLGLCLLVRDPSATVGTLPELGSSTWVWTGAPGEAPGPRGGGTAPRAVLLPWPQELEKKSEEEIRKADFFSWAHQEKKSVFLF